MNLVLALEQLGYENGTDFTVSADDMTVIAEWNHSDAQPNQTTLETAWNAWWTAHGPSLKQFRENAHIVVDNGAERTRSKYLTSGAGQAMTYLRKENDAEAYKTAGYPAITGSEYPWIKAEMDATSNTGQVVADDILAKRDAWITVGAEIEKQRRLGKLNVDSASDEESVNTARDNAIALLEAI